MKILYVDALRAKHAQSNVKGLTNAFKQVGKVIDFDYRTYAKISSDEAMNKSLYKEAIKHKPDLIFLGKCESVFGETIKRIKETIDTFVVSFLGDFYWNACPFKVDQGKYADVTLLSYWEKSIIQEYKDAGVKNLGYWTDGYDLANERFLNVEKNKDIVFFGTNHSVGNHLKDGYLFREKLIKTIDEKYNIYVYGDNWKDIKNIRGWVTGFDKTMVANESKITIGTPAAIACLYLSFPRVFSSMACKSLHITQYVPDLELLFKKGETIEWFNTIEECMDLIEYYFNNEDKLRMISEAGMNHVIKNHSYLNRVNGIIDCKVKDENNILSYLGVVDED